MNFTEVAVIGGGPAGLSAALAAAEAGAQVTVFDRNRIPGGQLIKQTHRFFGSEREYAGTRGLEIAGLLERRVTDRQIRIRRDTKVLGIYADGVITYLEGDHYDKLTAEKIIIATGASERMILFEKNDLPGIYGAGAVQTMMNLQGVLPGERVLMVGAGNIGLIVSYQLLQAGVQVVAVIDAAPRIGGYQVHASKLRRNGIPIYTGKTICAALGETEVTGAVLADTDGQFRPVPGTETEIVVDTICLAAGLSPLIELFVNTGCRTRYVPQLGGIVPVCDENMETSIKGIFAAGDAAAIEEASSAMLEGTIAGASAALDMGYVSDAAFRLREQSKEELALLRSGSSGEKIRAGLQILSAS